MKSAWKRLTAIKNTLHEFIVIGYSTYQDKEFYIEFEILKLIFLKVSPEMNSSFFHSLTKNILFLHMSLC